jgi:hypothetical protein
MSCQAMTQPHAALFRRRVFGRSDLRRWKEIHQCFLDRARTWWHPNDHNGSGYVDFRSHSGFDTDRRSIFLEAREWYLTLRENRVSGLITYWAFNSREFRVQMYAALSRLEELSRDVLAKDGCGISSENGLNLSAAAVDKIRVRFETAKSKLGGNRFVDELDFHQVNDALRKHSPWRNFLHDRLGSPVSNTEYERRHSFTGLRDAVMHGRIVFPTYQDFIKQVPCIANIT